jgi:hypothetical protein
VNRNEIIDLLTLIAGWDYRTVGEGDVMAWLVIAEEEHWTWPLARRAAINYHRRGGDKPRITPARITDAIDEVRATIRRTVLRTDLTPPKELAEDPRAEIAWRREYIQHTTDTALAAWADDQPMPTASALEAAPDNEPPPEVVRFADRFAVRIPRTLAEPLNPNDRRRLIEHARVELESVRKPNLPEAVEREAPT